MLLVKLFFKKSWNSITKLKQIIFCQLPYTYQKCIYQIFRLLFTKMPRTFCLLYILISCLTYFCPKSFIFMTQVNEIYRLDFIKLFLDHSTSTVASCSSVSIKYLDPCQMHKTYVLSTKLHT